MRDAWRELKMRSDDQEGEPLTLGKAYAPQTQTMGSGPAAQPVADPEEPDLWETGFTLRELGPQVVRLWVVLQATALFFQLLLWSEVANHLYSYEDVIAHQCAPYALQHGICIGPMWNLSSWQDVVLSSYRDTTHPESFSFTFATQSSPPTFLAVVDPVSTALAGEPDEVRIDPAADAQVVGSARWSAEVERLDPPQVGPPMKAFHGGQRSMTFEDLSKESAATLATKGKVLWKLTLSAHSQRKRNYRYVVFVEDAVTAHLKDLKGNTQCTFSQSWKAFNEQHQGRGHKTLSWCRVLLGVFVFVGAAMVYLVHSGLHKGGAVGFRFHLVVLAKFIIQDFPQQVCIVLYLLGWFEVSGLRCQLCLFHPHHCAGDSAFHLTNSCAIVFTLMSSVANQLLVRPAFRRRYTEDDICLMYTIRIATGCVCVLPFTTGVCFASKTLLPAATFLHTLAAVPCGIGWLAVLGGILVPCLMFCDESCDDP